MSEQGNRNIFDRMFMIGAEEETAAYEAPPRGPWPFLITIGLLIALAALLRISAGTEQFPRRAVLLETHQAAQELVEQGGILDDVLARAETMATGAPLGLMELSNPPLLSATLVSLSPALVSYATLHEGVEHVVIVGRLNSLSNGSGDICRVLKGRLISCLGHQQLQGHPGFDAITVGPAAESLLLQIQQGIDGRASQP